MNAGPEPETRAVGVGRWLPGALAVVWVALLVAGMGILWRYKLTPGPAASVPGVWPSASSLHRGADQPTVVMFVHPCCPCTRASLDELGGLLPHFTGRITVALDAFRPSELPKGWNEAALHGALATLPGITLAYDTDGREAGLFGVKTSGHVLLYGVDGKLRFSGGISPSRGHVGDNPGLDGLRAAIEAELRGEDPATVAEAPVFGCALADLDGHPEAER